jgi:hypothetical protein
MQLNKLERLAVALIEVLADADIDISLRRTLRDTYDLVEISICSAQAAESAGNPPAESPSFNDN